MKNKIIDIAIIALLFVATALPQYQITNNVISSGGNVISNSNNNFVSTVGEAFIGKSSNTVNQNQIGFWYAFQQTTITDVEEEETIPTVFKLEQNYPNPFNPSTKITYSIPARSNVSLKVFDLLGSEVAELVKGEIEAGTYDISFNASNLPSGIYFYQLIAGEFLQTKKMILIK